MLYLEKQFRELFTRGAYDTRTYHYYIPYASGPLRRTRRPATGNVREVETVMPSRKLAAIRAALVSRDSVTSGRDSGTSDLPF